MNKLQQQYRQNVQAYKDLGLDIPVELSDITLVASQEVAIRKGTGQLVISPAITKDFTIFDLVDHFDKKQEQKSYIYKDLWEQYDLTSPASINVIDLTVGNEYGDPVTQHTNKTIDEQRQVEGEFMSPVEAIILMAVLRLGKERLAPHTFIRFPQLPNKTVDGDSLAGNVNSCVGRAGLAGSFGRAIPAGGLGVSVGARVELNTSDLPLSSALPSETEAISLLKGLGYEIWRKL